MITKDLQNVLLQGLNEYRIQALKSSVMVGILSFSSNNTIPTYSTENEIKCFDFYYENYDQWKTNIKCFITFIIAIMNTRRITDIFKRMFLPHVKTPLGRWNIHNYGETSLKIKYATEDNCGIYCYNNDNNHKMKKNELHNDREYMYMMGYESVH